jgi:hypothetical protein
LVRKDQKGNPRENDVTVCLNFLAELQNRIRMVQDHTKKAQKLEGDITEFIAGLAKRGVMTPPENPNPLTPPGMGQTGPAVHPTLEEPTVKERKKW